jgi:hypothetical protein
LTAFGSDSSATLEFAEQQKIKTWCAPAFSIETGDTLYLAVLSAFDFNAPALREQVKDALFGA